ncbi:hypothetical protein GQ54DRAFT_281101, partial [Martensiomyces pterosporus]
MFRRAPFGVKTLPLQFQRLIFTVFQDCTFVRAFIDDVIVFSKTWDEHKQHVLQAITMLNDAILI